MRLSQLAAMLNQSFPAADDREIVSVTEDSRRVQPGSVFFAAQGDRVDGHAFAPQAVQAGAIAIVGSRPELAELAGVPYFSAEMPRRVLGLLAHALVGDPSRALCVIGITGTNGKSSSVTLIRTVLDRCGRSCASFGTIGYVIGGQTIPAPHTTPFAEDLAHFFQQTRAAGHTHVVMEVSSHALEQERVAGIEFAVGAFTNLTQDHLDFHGDMDTYRRAKLKLFERIEGAGRFTVVNREDPSAEAFIAASRVPCHTYGCGAGDCQARQIQTTVRGTRFRASTPWGEADISMRLVGKHNVSNALGVIAVCGGLGVPLDEVAEGIAAVEGVPGRFELVDEGQEFHVVVDYAHTEDGLRNVLKAARTVCRRRIITVFGCGGDRDKTKRPKMGETAAELSDFVFVTSDNPRTEDPERILLDIEVGIQRRGKKKYEEYEVLLDRATAIHRAVELARAGDFVLIAGKGHEDYQILGTGKIHFDDREVARDALRALGTSSGGREGR